MVKRMATHADKSDSASVEGFADARKKALRLRRIQHQNKLKESLEAHKLPLPSITFHWPDSQEYQAASDAGQKRKRDTASEPDLENAEIIAPPVSRQSGLSSPKGIKMPKSISIIPLSSLDKVALNRALVSLFCGSKVESLLADVAQSTDLKRVHYKCFKLCRSQSSKL